MHASSQKAGTTLSLLTAIFIFGTVGLFRRWIPLPSGILAMSRGLIGMAFILLLQICRRQPPSKRDIRDNLPVLLLSGSCIGFNWILLFEAYAYTSVSTATLCYYMQPVLVILVSPFVLKERLTVRRALCVLAALAGMALVTGVWQTGISDRSEWKGILLGLEAAALYAGVILLNKHLHDIRAYDRTIVQLGAAAVVLIPYVILTGEYSGVKADARAVLMLLVVGIVHTGIAYALYFGAMAGLKAQTVALLSYGDPVVAIILSALLLHEQMGPLQILGAVLIIGAAVIGEL